MTAADRELSGVVRRWLMPGTTTLSDRVLESAMAEIAATPQRHRPRALRRWRALAPTTRFALVGTAAVAIVAMVGLGLLFTRPGPNIGPTVPTQRAIPSLTDRTSGTKPSLAPSPASGRVRHRRDRGVAHLVRGPARLVEDERDGGRPARRPLRARDHPMASR